MTAFDVNVTTEAIPRFFLTGGDEEPYPCVALAVLNAEDRALLWFLFADPEHFEPKDPKGFAKLRRRAERGRVDVPELATWARDERGVDLREVVYGIVPSGFVQVEPEVGSPVALANDRRYAFLAIGVETMLVEFSVGAA